VNRIDLDELRERAIVVDEHGQGFQKHGRKAWEFWYAANGEQFQIEHDSKCWTSLGLARDFEGLRLVWQPDAT
jgi:hypothetical protein